jgi:hypothetical protein
MKRILSVLFCISATAAICQAQSLLYFPQIADGIQSDGSRWGTIIIVTNPAPLGAGNSAGTLNFIKDDGTPLVIRWQNWGGQGSDIGPSPSPSIQFQLAAGQTTVFLSAGELGQSTTSLQTGFAKLDSNTPFSATVIFSEFGPGGGRIAQAGVLSATPSTKQEIIAIAPSGSSGSGTSNTNIYPPATATSALALANPGTTTATITFQLLDSSSFQVGSTVTRTLAANNHTAFFVTQLFPNTAIGGQLRFTSDVPIVATALLFQSNGEFATFPVFPLP